MDINKPMTRPRFSVVVPTRNRPETLRSALATCIDQTFDDYEIVVCDNGEGSETRRIVSEAGSTRVRYLAPTEPLAMSANWERGVAEAQGEYVTVLGDDDGLMPYALSELDALISKSGTKAIVWQRGIYTWPTIGIEGEANLLRLPLARNVVELDGREQIGKVIRFEAGTDSLPMIYTAVVHRDLIERHRQLAGRVFLNVYPDVYSAFGFGYLAGRYLHTSVPMNIAGLSHASNGVATLMNTSNNAVATDFDRLNAAFGYVRHPKVPDKMILGPVHVADCFLHAKDALFPDDDSLPFDRKAFTLRCLAANFEVDPMRRREVRQIIRASLEDDAALLNWFDAEAPDFPPGQPFSFQPPKLGFDGTLISLNTAPFDVKDIAGAVTLATRVLGLTAGAISYDLASWQQLHASIADAWQTAERMRQAQVNAVEQLAEAAAEQAYTHAQLGQLRAEQAHTQEQLVEARAAYAVAHALVDQARVAQSQAQTAEQDVQRQRDEERASAAATAARLQHLLGEAQLAASLRYVPKRLIAKLIRKPAKRSSPP